MIPRTSCTAAVFGVFLGACSTDQSPTAPAAATGEVIADATPESEGVAADATPDPGSGSGAGDDAVDAKVEDPAMTPYRTEAEALVAAIDAGTGAAEIGALADALTTTGLSMLPAMIEAHPVCKEYLDAITAVGPTLKDLPLAEIESGYHMDGKLPPRPSPECYHGKDLVVHPATVAALAKAGLSTPEDRRSAKGEIVEVLGHLTAIEPAK